MTAGKSVLGVIAAAVAAVALVAPASLNAQAAGPDIAAVNDRYRAPMGIPPLVEDAALAAVAAGHANYLNINGATGHEQEPGKPGFTGETLYDRCRSAASGEGCSEVVFPGMSSLGSAIAGWMRTPFHGAPFLSDQRVGCAVAGSSAVCNSSGLTTLTFDQSAPINSPSGWLRIWPASGMRDVPTRWYGGEIPDPLGAYEGDRSAVGTVFFVRTGFDATVSLVGPDGPVALLPPNGRTSSLSVNVRAEPVRYPSVRTFFAATRLRAEGDYRLTVTRSADGRTEDVPFRTAADPSPPQASDGDWGAGASADECAGIEAACSVRDLAYGAAATRRARALVRCNRLARSARSSCRARAVATHRWDIRRAEAAFMRRVDLAACAVSGSSSASCSTRARVAYTRAVGYARADYRRTMILAACTPRCGQAQQSRAQAAWKAGVASTNAALARMGSRRD